MASDKIVHLTKDSFQNDVLQSDQPVLVDFWAEWCAPCKAIAPILDEIAEEMDGRVRVGKVNVDEHQELASQFGIRGIPTLLLFVGGEVREQIVGLRDKKSLKETVEKHLG